MIKWGTISMVLVVVLVSSCSSTKNGENSDREDLTAKESVSYTHLTLPTIA